MSARKRCARCGTPLPSDSDRRIYSRFTGNYYCVDDRACGRRARRAGALRKGKEEGQ